jgi:hypothetical protein
MTKIRITTNRLPQPERHAGAILDVPPENAASLVAQGFAVILEEAAPEVKRPRGRKPKETAL